MEETSVVEISFRCQYQSTDITLGDEKKVIAIVDASGAQGGSLVRAIFDETNNSSNDFVARAIVPPDVSPETVETLSKLNAEVIETDLNDEAALQEAITGCYGMFCVTVFWEWQNINPDEETQLAWRMATAARNVGVKHVIWSTMEDTRKYLEQTHVPTVMGRYKVPQFDAKGAADRFFVDLPTTFLMSSFYWDNFIHPSFAPRKTIDGTWMLSMPMGTKRLPGIALEDIGKCALGIFQQPDHYIGKRIGIIGEALTGREMAEKMSQCLGDKEIHYEDVPFDEYRLQQSVQGAQEQANMFAFYHECENQVLAARSYADSCQFNPKMMTFDQWLAKYKDFIPIGA